MCPEARASIPVIQPLSIQRGAGLPLAIFLITVMVLIVATIARIQQTAGETEALEIQSARAFYAAESALQLHFADVFPNDEEDSIPCEDNSFDFVGARGLSGCSVDVICLNDIAGSGNGEEDLVPVVKIYQSQATCGSGPDGAVRTLEVQVQ